MPRVRAVLALAVAVTACSSMKVEVEYSRSANFKGYRTYAWISQPPGPEQAPAARDPRVREAVVSSIDRGLAAKGLTRTDPDKSPDLLVAVYGWSAAGIDVHQYGYGYGYYGYHPSSVSVREYRAGTLIIDLVDAATKQMVWRGTASDTFDPGAEAKTVVKAVEKTLEEYPPPP